MKIGIDASRANKPIKTGVEWYSYHLINALKKIDSDNRYFLYTDKPLINELAAGPANFQQVLLKWPPKRMWTLIRLSWAMKFGKYQPDVLFVPAHTLPLLNPKKTVVTVHDIGFKRFPEIYKWTARLYHTWSSRFIKKHATQIITISEFSKKEIMDVYKIPAEKIKVVYLGYNDHDYKFIADKLAVKDQIQNKFKIDAPYFLFIGRIEAKKNISRLIEAFSEFKRKHSNDQHKLVLIGQPGFEHEKIKENIIKFKLEQAVIELGWLKSDDCALLMNGADLFVFPSLYEGFGLPVLEAMACGCPVICSNTTSLPEVAGEAAIKFNPENVKVMVKAIEAVVFNLEIKQSLVEQGFEQIKKFSWLKCAQQTLKVLENV